MFSLSKCAIIIFSIEFILKISLFYHQFKSFAYVLLQFIIFHVQINFQRAVIGAFSLFHRVTFEHNVQHCKSIYKLISSIYPHSIKLITSTNKSFIEMRKNVFGKSSETRETKKKSFQK